MQAPEKKTVDVTDESFVDLLEQNPNTPVLVDFWAPWCMPCKMMAPVLEEVAEKVGDKAIVAKLNTEDNPGVPGALGVRAIPTMAVFRGREVIDVFVGVRPAKDLIRALEKHSQ